MKLASYQQQLAKHYNKKVNPRAFRVGDYVLRKVLGSVVKPSDGKLGPNWERPFKITRDDLRGAYHLETLEGRYLEHGMQPVLRNSISRFFFYSSLMKLEAHFLIINKSCLAIAFYELLFN